MEWVSNHRGHWRNPITRLWRRGILGPVARGRAHLANQDEKALDSLYSNCHGQANDGRNENADE